MFESWKFWETETVDTLPERSVNEDPQSLKRKIIGNRDGNLADRVNDHRNEAGNYQIAAAMSTIYTQVSHVRTQMMAELDRLSTFWLTDAIITQLAEDSINTEVSSDNIINVYSPDNKDAQEEIKYLESIINFDELINGVIYDLVTYGEYTLSTKFFDIKEGKKVDNLNPNESKKMNDAQEDEPSKDKQETRKGIEAIYDDVDQSSVIALTSITNEIEGFLVLDENKIKVVDKTEFIKFSIPSKKLRINLHKEFDKSMRKRHRDIFRRLPKYVRMGRSLIYSVRSKLKELELLEQLVPATKLSKLSNGSLIGVQVPPNMDIKKAISAVKKIEGVINKKIGYDDSSKEITVENIMSSAGKMKCVPLFGDKGQLQVMDYKSSEPDDLLASVEDVRKSICSSIGIPYEFIFQNDSESKNTVLKRYARYLRKLKSIQRAIIGGIRQIVEYHLTEAGVSFVESDIKLEFHNKLVEIDNLDKLEFLDTTVSMVDNIKRFVFELVEEDSPVKEAVDINALVRFMDEQFTIVGLKGLINSNKKVASNTDDPEDDHDDDTNNVHY